MSTRLLTATATAFIVALVSVAASSDEPIQQIQLPK
jgi:hypothetical protein